MTRVFVTAGEHVRAGQPLAAFAPPTSWCRRAATWPRHRRREAQAQAQLAQTRSNLARQVALAPAEAASQRDVEQARTDLATAEQALATARANEAAARGRLEVLNVPAASASPAAASGRPSAAAVIRAPIDGVVTSRQVGQGQFVNSYTGGASTPLLVLSDLSRVWLVANLRDADASRVRRGATLSARVPALDGRTFTGRVVFVSPVVDPAAHRGHRARRGRQPRRRPAPGHVRRVSVHAAAASATARTFGPRRRVRLGEPGSGIGRLVVTRPRCRRTGRALRMAVMAGFSPDRS